MPQGLYVGWAVLYEKLQRTYKSTTVREETVIAQQIYQKISETGNLQCNFFKF